MRWLRRSFFYHCKREFVVDKSVDRRIFRPYYPSAAETVAKSVQRIHLPLSEKFLQTVFAHGQWQSRNFQLLPNKRLEIVGAHRFQDFLERYGLHSNTKTSRCCDNTKSLIAKRNPLVLTQLVQKFLCQWDAAIHVFVCVGFEERTCDHTVFARCS